MEDDSGCDALSPLVLKLSKSRPVFFVLVPVNQGRIWREPPPLDRAKVHGWPFGVLAEHFVPFGLRLDATERRSSRPPHSIATSLHGNHGCAGSGPTSRKRNHLTHGQVRAWTTSIDDFTAATQKPDAEPQPLWAGSDRSGGQRRPMDSSIRGDR